MHSEKEKMLSGELYNAMDPQLVAERRRARLLLRALNDTRDDQQEERARHPRDRTLITRLPLDKSSPKPHSCGVCPGPFCRPSFCLGQVCTGTQSGHQGPDLHRTA
jgi:hypothetical protein